MLLKQGPFHAWHAHRELGGGIERTSKAMEGGTLIDELGFIRGEPVDATRDLVWTMKGEEVAGSLIERRAGKVVITGEFKTLQTNAAKAWRDAVREDGCVPVLQHVADAVIPAIDKVRAAFQAAGFNLEAAHVKERIHWDHDGIPCEGEPDVWEIVDGMMEVVDLKTTETYDPARIARSAVVDWAIQRAAYLDGLSRLHPDFAGRQRWRWLVGEQKHPHFVAWATDGDWGLRQIGESQWARAVQWWGRLLDLGWDKPWKPEDLQLEAPEYAVAQEEREAMEYEDSNL
ncbi:MAG: hypothetical protein GY926_19455 [bacterium]|nr:hypothetical protein [bacterium]